MSNATDFSIFWNSGEGHEEVQGIYLYGLFALNVLPNLTDLIERNWMSENGKTQIGHIESEFGTVVVVALKLQKIPSESEWYRNLECSLIDLVERGARVAWAGGEDCSWNPDVLNPTSDSGNVYAAMTVSTNLICNDTFGIATQFVSADQLSSIWNAVREA